MTSDLADVRVVHLDPHFAIGQVGGVSLETGQRFCKKQKVVIKDIQLVMNYFVAGKDGSQAQVSWRALGGNECPAAAAAQFIHWSRVQEGQFSRVE